MHRLLERLDAAASTIVPVAYLGGLLLGTMSYFAGVTLNAGLAVGVALALAAELHSFLEQRRCRALWTAYNRSADPDSRQHLAAQLKAHSAILAALVLFSAVNATAFAAETWHPTAGFIPVWLQVGLRGAVVPLLFLLTGALSPLTVNAGDELVAASRHMLHKTIKATLRQWNSRIERARRSGVDLAPVAVSLMLDAGDSDGARRIRLIAEGLRSAETGATAGTNTLPIIVRPAGDLLSALQEAPHAPLAPETPTRPPTGPGTPTRRRASKRARPGAILQLTPPAESAETRIRAALALDPAVSIRQLAQRAGVSESSASKWRKVVRLEAAHHAAAAQ